MEKKAPQSKVLLFQSVGFLAIIALSWLDELLGLPSLIFKDHPYISNFRESALEMLLVLGVWFLVNASTRRMLGHVHYLQGFMRVCAWCRRIDYQGRWIRLEEFLQQGFDTPTSHGICPDCLQEETAARERAHQARKLEVAAGPCPCPGQDDTKQ